MTILDFFPQYMFPYLTSSFWLQSDHISMQLFLNDITIRFVVCHRVILKKSGICRNKHLCVSRTIKQTSHCSLLIAHEQIHFRSRIQLSSTVLQNRSWTPLYAKISTLTESRRATQMARHSKFCLKCERSLFKARAKNDDTTKRGF